MKTYRTTDQITDRKDKYEFKPPVFGESTTDPTYYEPTATRIANMKKAAYNGITLYDFDDKNKMPDDISKIRVAPGRKPYMTKEEISQEVNDIKDKLQNEFSKDEADKENLAKEIKNVKETISALKEENSTDNAGNNDE